MNRFHPLVHSFGIAAAIYVAAYVPCSAGGRYEVAPQGFIGQVHWSPNLESNFGKTLFRPLLEFDRRLVHKSYHRC